MRRITRRTAGEESDAYTTGIGGSGPDRQLALRAGGGHRLTGAAGRGTRATDLLARLKIAHTVHSYEHDPRGGAYGLEAAAALGVPPERVVRQSAWNRMERPLQRGPRERKTPAQ